jgi:hypothetical protein
MVCRRIHESLEPHRVKSDYDTGGPINMHRISSALKSNPHTQNFDTSHPHHHPKHRGLF